MSFGNAQHLDPGPLRLKHREQHAIKVLYLSYSDSIHTNWQPDDLLPTDLKCIFQNWGFHEVNSQTFVVSLLLIATQLQATKQQPTKNSNHFVCWWTRLELNESTSKIDKMDSKKWQHCITHTDSTGPTVESFFQPTDWFNEIHFVILPINFRNLKHI